MDGGLAHGALFENKLTPQYMIKVISRGSKNGCPTAQIVQIINGKSHTKHLGWSYIVGAFVDSKGIPYKSVEKPK